LNIQPEEEDPVIRSLSLSLLLMLGACAQAPMAPEQADQEAKRFDQPAPDKGAVYIYRSGLMGLVQPIDVAIAGGANARLPYNTYLRLEGPPGPIEVDCRVGDRTGSGQVQIADGQTRFVEVTMTVGWLAPGCAVAEVPPDQGQSAVRAARRVAVQ
jgi:hypothetical protein